MGTELAVWGKVWGADLKVVGSGLALETTQLSSLAFPHVVMP
jgi:hypothetical protein